MRPSGCLLLAGGGLLFLLLAVALVSSTRRSFVERYAVWPSTEELTRPLRLHDSISLSGKIDAHATSLPALQPPNSSQHTSSRTRVKSVIESSRRKFKKRHTVLL